MSEARRAPVIDDAGLPDRADGRPAPMFALQWWMPFAVFIPAYVLRLLGMESVRNPLEDMYMHVPNAFNYASHGLLGPDNWWTQPAKHLLLRTGIMLFGNDLVGWRMMGVVLGATGVVVAALIARRLFRSPFPALVVAVLLALDPLGIAFSRTTFEDTAAVCMMLLAVLMWLRAMEDGRDSDWLVCGAILGIAGAFRWYVLLAGALMLVVSLVSKRREGIVVLSRTATALTLVPLTTYVVWWLPWMARGYSLGEWLQLQRDAFAVQGTSFSGFTPFLQNIVDPEGWMIRWVGLALRRPSDGGEVVTLMVNNPVIWVLFLPAIVWLLYRGVMTRRAGWVLVALAFVVTYGFFVLTSRPILLYSALAIVPLGALAIAYAADSLGGRVKWVFLAAATAWALYLYPLAAGLGVPLQPYSWLLERVATVGVGS